MSRPLPPTITVRFGAWQRTFAPGDDVVIGRDVRADLRLLHPAVSRAHMVLRYIDGRWAAIDNNSLNGIFVRRQRVSSVDIRNGETVNIGNPDGPPLIFELGPTAQPHNQTREHSDRKTDVLNIATAMRARWRTAPAAAPPRGTTIGRTSDNDIVIPDMLASQHHAVLVPTAQGVQIEDAGSNNGTFVNGRPVEEAALRDTDVVTIGNVDLVFADGTLVRRTDPAARTGGLDVRDVSLTIHGGRTLLDRISSSSSRSSSGVVLTLHALRLVTMVLTHWTAGQDPVAAGDVLGMSASRQRGGRLGGLSTATNSCSGRPVVP